MRSAQLAGWRHLTVAVIAVLPLCSASPAHAVSPPPIDQSRLPPPAPAHPPQPTVQREICAIPSLDRKTGAPVDATQLSALDLHQVWRLTRGSGQRVAVIDTGVAAHPRLPRLRPGGDYVSTGDGTQDCDGHGTAVAGIIGATEDPDHADGFSGVAPESGLISIRQSSTRFAATNDSAASGSGDVDTMARAVRTAADLGASVINISSVACVPADTALDDRSLGAALSYAVDTKNVVVVAAAGNTGAGHCPAQQLDATRESATVAVSPAWYDEYVLTVGSVNTRGEPSAFSLAGPWVDVAAPGEGVISLSSSGDGLANAIAAQQGSTPLSGTSYAAPVVSGLAALVRSRFPTWTARQVMQRIKATAHHLGSGTDPRIGAGMVDFLAAVSTDSPTVETPPAPATSAPVADPPPPPPADHRARRTAFAGAAVCGGLLVMTLCVRAVSARLRRTARGSGNILSD
jgi:membrane-anchored mycosin MYCP